MDSIISTFHIDWKIILAQALNFGLVLLVLYRFVFKPLGKIMEERSGKIAKGLQNAKENERLLTETKQEYEATLAQARREAQALLEAGKKEAELKKEEMLREAKASAAALSAREAKKLSIEKEKMVKEAKGELAELTLKTAEKLLGTKLDASYDRKVLGELGNL